MKLKNNRKGCFIKNEAALAYWQSINKNEYIAICKKSRTLCSRYRGSPEPAVRVANDFAEGKMGLPRWGKGDHVCGGWGAKYDTVFRVAKIFQNIPNKIICSKFRLQKNTFRRIFTEFDKDISILCRLPGKIFSRCSKNNILFKRLIRHFVPPSPAGEGWSVRCEQNRLTIVCAIWHTALYYMGLSVAWAGSPIRLFLYSQCNLDKHLI